MTNPNRVVLITDCHVVSNDSEAGLVGETYPSHAKVMARLINNLEPYQVYNGGDDKDHYGNEAAVGDELDNFKTNLYNVLNWRAPTSGGNVLRPMLPGNHDATLDYTDEGANDFSVWETRFWQAPYHWYDDWPAPQIRFIGLHVEIIHEPDAQAGYFSISESERTYLTAQLAALPVGYKAVILTHAPLDPEFGNEVHADHGGTEVRATLASNAAKIAGCLSGHRHGNGNSHTLSGVLHVSCPSLAYTENNAAGGFFLLEYDGVDTLTAHYRTGVGTLFGAYDPAVYVPVEISI